MVHGVLVWFGLPKMPHFVGRDVLRKDEQYSSFQRLASWSPYDRRVILSYTTLRLQCSQSVRLVSLGNRLQELSQGRLSGGVLRRSFVLLSDYHAMRLSNIQYRILQIMKICGVAYFLINRRISALSELTC